MILIFIGIILRNRSEEMQLALRHYSELYLVVGFQELCAVKRITRGQAISFVPQILNADWRAG